MPPTRRTVILAALLLAACTDAGPAGSRETGAGARQEAPSYTDVERIATAYHGLLLDADLKEIKLDVPLIASMQLSLFDRLLPKADPKVQEEIRLLRLQADERGFHKDDRVLADNAILGSLLEQSAQDLRARYDWRYRMVRSQSWQIIDISLHPDVLEWIRERGLAPMGIPGKGDGGAYVAACRAESVPTPPEFPSTHWGDSTVLEPEFNFLDGAGDVLVYTYADADGVCYALPRRGRGLLGIICQSQRTGKACFYDNLRSGTGQRIDWTRETMTAWEASNGNDLDEACTDCHRGTNAFVIHPGSALDRPGVSTYASVRYTPIGGPAFQNPGPLALPAVDDPVTQSCEGCHEIPQLTGSYCTAILAPAARTTMPLGQPPAGWIPPDSHDYYLHLAFLWTQCGGG